MGLLKVAKEKITRSRTPSPNALRKPKSGLSPGHGKAKSAAGRRESTVNRECEPANPAHASIDSKHTSDDIRGKSAKMSETIDSNSTNFSPVAKEADKFYPVKLGDVFHNGRYVVKGYLGCGRYSTVWLIKDTKSNLHFALKILNSDFYNGRYELFELEVMERIAKVSSTSSHPGRECVAEIMDDFEVVGPTGKHVCMVYRLLGANIAKQSTQARMQHLPYHAVKQITRQLLQALDFLHTECGVIHTDISPSNICIELPDPEAEVAAAKADEGGQVNLATPLLTKEKNIRVRLNDFGIACFVDRHLTDKISPPLLRAPEITLGAPWDQGVDIFNLGALTLQFLTGQLPFPGRGDKGNAEGDRLTQLIKSFGGEPDVVIKHADRAEEFSKRGIDLRRAPTISAKTSLEKFVTEHATGSSMQQDMPREDVLVVCNMLRRMLATDPIKRESAKELLRHPWLAT